TVPVLLESMQGLAQYVISDVVVHFNWRSLRGSCLFPYTTLFRSRRALAQGARDPEGGGLLEGAEPAWRNRWVGGERGPVVAAVLDRKSTRLNSSHRTISYAVFCLKKNRIQMVLVIAIGVTCSTPL